MARTIIEAEKSPNLQLAIWRPRRAANVSYSLRRGEDQSPSSNSQTGKAPSHSAFLFYFSLHLFYVDVQFRSSIS